MLRPRDLLTVTLPAALLAFAVQPLLDSAAPAVEAKAISIERLGAPRADSITPSLDGAVAIVVRAQQPEPQPAARRAEETPAAPVAKPLRRVGCEVAISALAGREARQLLPSRCLV